jgi:hypothetical protein
MRCDHCGRPVRGTQHTRSDYRVDYYAVHGGRGEICPLIGNYAGAGGTYVRLLDHTELISCAQCYVRADVRAERERCFRPERVGEDGGPA